jgi:hypothetical protein
MCPRTSVKFGVSLLLVGRAPYETGTIRTNRVGNAMSPELSRLSPGFTLRE